VETHFQYLSASAIQKTASGNKAETSWKNISGIFPLREPKPKALGMVSFTKMFPEEATLHRKKRRTRQNARQARDKHWTDAKQVRRIKARFLPLAAIKEGRLKKNPYLRRHSQGKTRIRGSKLQNACFVWRRCKSSQILRQGCRCVFDKMAYDPVVPLKEGMRKRD
jgi:hypothetical protein